MGMLMRRHLHEGRQQEKPTGTPLPDNLPGRAALIAAGLTTIETVTAHADLTTVKGIGQATADRIHEQLTPAPEPEKDQGAGDENPEGGKQDGEDGPESRPPAD